jgi:HD-like signal output (HDOD) protein
MNRLEALQLVALQAQRGEIVFPTSLALSSRIRVALDDPDIHLAAAARLIQSEPLLAARCVALSNSVAYQRNGDAITDVASAVARIGLRTVRSMAQALIVRQIAGAPRSDRNGELVARLWEHTAHVASLSRLIARHVTHLDPETALFAGLVHDVGSFYLLSRCDELPALLDAERGEAEEAIEIDVHRRVAATLDLPAPIVEALEIVWQGYVASPPLTLGDTVALAKELAPVASPLVRLADAREIAPIDMLVGEEHLSGILLESAGEIDSLTRALTF